MKIAINAIPVHPGGGLTVLLGLLDGLRCTSDQHELVVLASAPETIEAVRHTQHADAVVPILTSAGATRTFLWQNLALGSYLGKQDFDHLLTINHHLLNVPCPQVVYHLNLRRFSLEHRSSSVNERLQEGIRDWSARQALRHATVNVFESAFLQHAAEQIMPGPTHNSRVVYIGLPDKLVDRAATLVADVAGEPRLISVTSPLAHKDNPTMLHTVARLVQLAPDVNWQLDVVGGTDPGAWQPFQEMARQLKIADRVTWHGYCDHARLDELLGRSLCMVSTSCMESFAMVAIEAMARRCPTVVARTAAMPESVGDAGVLVKPGAADGFAAAVLKIYREPRWREHLVRSGVDWIQKFRWSTCGQQFSQIFSDITGRKAAA